MQCKYIILKGRHQDTGVDHELPVIFPNIMVHKEVAESLCRHEDFGFLQAVSAGFVSFTPRGPECHGRSESLNLNSRPQDSKVLKMLENNWSCTRVDYHAKLADR